MKTILVTGGAGFFGSNLVAALVERGTHHVVVCDRFGTDNKWRNLAKHPVSDVIAPERLSDWLVTHGKQVEMIYHLGSISSTVEMDVDLILKNNVTTSTELWHWAALHGVRFVYASASAVYGDGSQGFNDSLALADLKKLRPMSAYGWSKLLFDNHVAEHVVHGYASPPQWVGLRFFNAYGPNEYHKGDQQSVITKIALHAIQSGNVKLFRSYRKDYPDGGQKRDVLYVKDAVRVMLWLLDTPSVNGLFNLGTGNATTFLEMANAIFAAIGREPRVQFSDMPESLAPIYQYFTQANIDKLRAAGYHHPFHTPAEGIRDYVQNYLTKSDIYL